MATGGFIHAREEIGLRKTGAATSISNHPKARLMYYMSCVSTVLELDNPNLRRLTDYSNFYLLDEDDTDALLVLVILFSPDELLGKVFFASDEMCGDSANEFYELSQVSHTFAVTSNVIIGGQQRRVVNIMTFKMAWLHNNYLNPIKQYAQRIQNIADGRPTHAPAMPAITYHSQPTYYTRPAPVESGCCTIL